MVTRGIGTQDEIDDIEAEVKIMSQTSSPYIVGFYASYIVNTDLWIVMEYCNNGACAELVIITVLPRCTLSNTEYTSL